MNILILILAILGAFISFNLVISYINKHEDEDSKLMISKKERLAMVGIISILTIMLYVRYGLSVYGAIYYILFNQLTLIGLIDYKMKVIYSFTNKIIFILSVFFLVYQLNNGGDAKLYTVGLLFSILISVIINTFNLWGDGDRNLIIALSFFISAIQTPIPEINYVIINIIISGALAGIKNILALIFVEHKFNYRKREAFAPYIAMSTILSVLFMGV